MAGVFRQEHYRDLAKVWIGAGEIISRSRSDLDRDLLIQHLQRTISEYDAPSFSSAVPEVIAATLLEQLAITQQPVSRNLQLSID